MYCKTDAMLFVHVTDLHLNSHRLYASLERTCVKMGVTQNGLRIQKEHLFSVSGTAFDQSGLQSAVDACKAPKSL